MSDKIEKEFEETRKKKPHGKGRKPHVGFNGQPHLSSYVRGAGRWVLHSKGVERLY